MLLSNQSSYKKFISTVIFTGLLVSATQPTMAQLSNPELACIVMITSITGWTAKKITETVAAHRKESSIREQNHQKAVNLQDIEKQKLKKECLEIEAKQLQEQKKQQNLKIDTQKRYLLDAGFNHADASMLAQTYSEDRDICLLAEAKKNNTLSIAISILAEQNLIRATVQDAKTIAQEARTIMQQTQKLSQDTLRDMTSAAHAANLATSEANTAATRASDAARAARFEAQFAKNALEQVNNRISETLDRTQGYAKQVNVAAGEAITSAQKAEAAAQQAQKALEAIKQAKNQNSQKVVEPSAPPAYEAPPAYNPNR